MAMTSQEARSAYDSLVATLTEKELDWVLHQVSVTIAAGKPSPKEIVIGSKSADSRESLFLEIPATMSRRGRKELRETTESFTDQDQLRILLEAIEHALAVPALYTSDAFRLLNEAAVPVDEIMFASDRDQEVHTHRESEAGELSAVAERLRSALKEAIGTV